LLVAYFNSSVSGRLGMNDPPTAVGSNQQGGSSMRILVSASHGLVGKALISALSRDGNEIVSLVRKTSTGKGEIEWHPNKGTLDPKQLEGFDSVIHLAGESIASGRWTDEKKQKIRESRVQVTTLLSEAL